MSYFCLGVRWAQLWLMVGVLRPMGKFSPMFHHFSLVFARSCGPPPILFKSCGPPPIFTSPRNEANKPYAPWRPFLFFSLEYCATSAHFLRRKKRSRSSPHITHLPLDASTLPSMLRLCSFESKLFLFAVFV